MLKREIYWFVLSKLLIQLRDITINRTTEFLINKIENRVKQNLKIFIKTNNDSNKLSVFLVDEIDLWNCSQYNNLGFRREHRLKNNLIINRLMKLVQTIFRIRPN